MATEEERAYRKGRDEAKLADDNVKSIIRTLCSTREGRKFLWWLLQIGKVGLQPFSPDPHLTSFSCGELNVGQQVLAKILEAEPSGYLQMIKDQEDESNRRANAERERGGETFLDERVSAIGY